MFEMGATPNVVGPLHPAIGQGPGLAVPHLNVGNANVGQIAEPEWGAAGALLRNLDRVGESKEPDVIAQTTVATRQDVKNGSRLLTTPAPLRSGEAPAHSLFIAPKAILWSQGIRQINGVKCGEGLFYPEMFLLNCFVDLAANPHALNETIRYAYKILLPF